MKLLKNKLSAYVCAALLLSAAPLFCHAKSQNIFGLKNAEIKLEAAEAEIKDGAILMRGLPSDTFPKLKIIPQNGGGAWDFSKYKYAVFEVENVGDKPVNFTLWALSKGGFSGATVKCDTPFNLLKPNEKAVFKVDLETRFEGADAFTDCIDRSAVSSLEVVMQRAGPLNQQTRIYENAEALKILNISLEGEPLKAVDKAAISKRYKTPEISADAKPAADKRFFRTLPEYENTALRHCIYLPQNWQPGKKYPVIVEYTGNVYYNQTAYCYSTGYARQGNLACGIARGKDYICINMPFVAAGGQKEQFDAWGDPDLTAQYCLDALNDTFKNLGGDPKNVFYVGFSRGEFASNYIALRNDKIAAVWRAFVNFDPTLAPAQIWGQKPSWNNAAEGWQERAARLGSRPVISLKPRYGKAHVDVQYLEDSPSALQTQKALKELCATP